MQARPTLSNSHFKFWYYTVFIMCIRDPTKLKPKSATHLGLFLNQCLNIEQLIFSVHSFGMVDSTNLIWKDRNLCCLFFATYLPFSLIWNISKCKWSWKSSHYQAFLYMEVSVTIYSGKGWWGESLANHPWFAKLKPFKLVPTINNLLAELLIHQTFFCQMLKNKSICQTFLLYDSLLCLVVHEPQY